MNIMSAINQSFIKILSDPESSNLKLPASFIRKCRRKLPDKVTLKAPNGSIRKVDLVHSNGETLLHGIGWQEFKDYYSIGFGHLLVFEYDRNSHFDVLIFDKTTVEIVYPIDVSTDDDDEEEEEMCRKVTKKSLILDKETSIAYQRAKSFESKSPFFISLMHPSYVKTKFTFNIPAAFARDNLPKKSMEIKLRVGNEGIWNVKYLSMTNQASLSAGWVKFAKDNHLRVGDVCVFEVIKKLVWNVTIYRR